VGNDNRSHSSEYLLHPRVRFLFTSFNQLQLTRPPTYSVRALGETDLNPVSAIGKISQLLFAIVQPNNVVANLVAGGISEAGAQQAGDLMQDLKTGYLWQASPKAQFQGQVSFFRSLLLSNMTHSFGDSSLDRSRLSSSRLDYTACIDEFTNYPQPLSQSRQQLFGTSHLLLPRHISFIEPSTQAQPRSTRQCGRTTTSE